MGQALGRFSSCFSSRQAGRTCMQKRNVAAATTRPTSLTHENNRVCSPSKPIVSPTLTTTGSNPARHPSEVVVPPTNTITKGRSWTGVASEHIVSTSSVDNSVSNMTINPAKVVVSPTPANAESSWAWLPYELVGIIVERLAIGDYFRFCAVCASWGSAVALGGYLPPRNHFPWLMLSHDPYSFLSFSDNRSYHFHSEITNIECLGSQDGWLVSLHGFSQSCLLNPITRSQINLPPFSPNVHIRKVVLSSSTPSSAVGNSFIIVAMYGLLNYRLAFTRAGNPSWTPIRLSHGMDQDVEDVVFHDGKFFCISSRGQVQAVDLSGCSTRASSFPNSYIGAVVGSTLYTGYLVSSTGDLLRVWKQRDARSKKTTNFIIMKFNPETHCCWDEIKDLGTQSLFLDSKHSMSLSATDVRGLKGNCIYFTNERMDFQENYVSDVGVFDIESGIIQPCFPPKLQFGCSLQLPPIWFMPSLS